MNDMSKTETAREIVMLVSELVATGLMIYAAYKALVDVDAQKVVRMRVARGTARFAKTQSDWWSTLANKADTYYWRTANVTV
jgi:hypothetical protein